MADELEVLDTPAPEVDEVVEQDPPGTEVELPFRIRPAEPFLPVNDRTSYRTREDAVRGFNEAANRIQQLSQWEKEAKQWGLGDPAQLRAVANELLQLRREKAEAAAQAGKRNVEPRVDPADPKAKEAAQVREYMKSLGYVSKEEQEEALKELREFVNEYRQNDSRSTELRFETQEADARDDVAGYLSYRWIQGRRNGNEAIHCRNAHQRLDQRKRGAHRVVESWGPNSPKPRKRGLRLFYEGARMEEGTGDYRRRSEAH